MDITAFLLKLGSIVVRNSEYKPYYRSLADIDGYMKINITDSQEGYRIDFELIDMPKDKINEEIFYMRVPPSGTPYTCSAALKQLIKPDAKKQKDLTSFIVGSGLSEGHKFKNFLLDFSDAWLNKKVKFPNDWVEGLSLDDFLKQRYGNKLNSQIQSALAYNGEIIMSDEECRRFYLSKVAPTSNIENSNCMYCGSTKNLTSGGATKWKMYTTTRQTQTTKNDNVRCVNCDNKLSFSQELMDSKRINLGGEVFTYLFPVTEDMEQLKQLYALWEREEIDNEYNRFQSFKNIISNYQLENIKEVVQVTLMNQKQNTFEVLNIDNYNISKNSLIKSLNNENKIKDFIDKYQLNLWKKFSFSGLLQTMWKDKNTDNAIYNALSQEIMKHTLGYSSMSLDKFSAYLRRQEQTKNISNKGNERKLTVYELAYLLTKGDDIVDLVKSREYAIGVLFRIASDLERKAKGIDWKDQTNLERKYNKLPSSLDKVAETSVDMIRKYNNMLSYYRKQVIQLALKNLEYEPIMKSKQKIAFSTGSFANDFYPDEIEKRVYEESSSDNVTVDEIEEGLF